MKRGAQADQKKSRVVREGSRGGGAGWGGGCEGRRSGAHKTVSRTTSGEGRRDPSY